MHSCPVYNIFIGAEQIKMLFKKKEGFAIPYRDFRDLKKNFFFSYFGKNIEKNTT